jgi:hypothetical protein
MSLVCRILQAIAATLDMDEGGGGMPPPKP